MNQSSLALTLFVISVAWSLTAASPASAIDDPSDDQVKLGASIFAGQCSSCHGNNGEGTEENYPDPLTGDASIGELAELISDTMPEEDPDQCVGDDAKAVATYIHHQFYSEAAQLRNRPPRLALQRLTGDQLRQSLSNLYGVFSQIRRDEWNARQTENGMEAKYYTGTKWDDRDRKITRTDPQIDFDFGVDGPKNVDGSDAGIDGTNFHTLWSGGIRVEQTGRYEIVVRSTTSFECTFAHDSYKLIDNHVQSEGRNEFRRSLYLTGGRTYLITINLNQRKRKGATPPSSISLSWVPPGGVEEIIPSRYLVPGWVPPTLRLSTQMPPDDRTYGFQRGISVDPTWDDAVTSAALEFADRVIDEAWPDYRKQNKKSKLSRDELLREFLTQLIEVAHRSPPKQSDANRIVDIVLKENEVEADRIRHAILLTIKSPRFLYPSIDRDRTRSWRAGVQLSLALHDSLPGDRWLVDKINKNELENADQRRRTAIQLVDDARTRAKVREMFHHWLEVTPTDDLRKDEERFAGFDASVVSDLRQSLDLFIDSVVWSEASDYRELMAADWTITSPRLTEFYGDAWKPSEDEASPQVDRFRASVRDRQTHVGVLTHPLVMAKFAHHQTTSPIHRGVFLIRHVMGRTLRPPNSAFAPLSPDLHPDLTTRQRVELQTSPASCQICHAKINPLGFALEHFDAVGRYRKTENSKPIDASGGYTTRDDEDIQFGNARDLGDYVASSPDAQTAFVSRVFQYFVKQPIAAYGPDRLDQLTRKFRESNFNIRKLLVEVAMICSED
ncbi:DUF1588 domain-containing protein [Aporhodopirellula aestuarii]|uniref:DUF1588 domain-containing protein n=1 Tax=Aporhodopirellula aestuarii TaxID=2950107 RepID=A0ABT0U5H9_9BACT|nr:DUF1588 domain-containing protein [Aporhodopirellula aestuarii]MCM2372178.1 DUF1588 domain-containing protein [Aporhodopirellula aestuarii]